MKILRNHFIERCIRDVEDLEFILKTRKSIYYSPLNRVLPCKFFMGHSWKKKLIAHMINGDFYACVKKTDISTQRIRKTLLNAICEYDVTLLDGVRRRIVTNIN